MASKNAFISAFSVCCMQMCMGQGRWLCCNDGGTTDQSLCIELRAAQRRAMPGSLCVAYPPNPTADKHRASCMRQKVLIDCIGSEAPCSPSPPRQCQWQSRSCPAAGRTACSCTAEESAGSVRVSETMQASRPVVQACCRRLLPFTTCVPVHACSTRALTWASPIHAWRPWRTASLPQRRPLRGMTCRPACAWRGGSVRMQKLLSVGLHIHGCTSWRGMQEWERRNGSNAGAGAGTWVPLQGGYFWKMHTCRFRM